MPSVSVAPLGDLERVAAVARPVVPTLPITESVIIPDIAISHIDMMPAVEAITIPMDTLDAPAATAAVHVDYSHGMDAPRHVGNQRVCRIRLIW